MSKQNAAFFDYPLYQDALEQIDFSNRSGRLVINTINPHSFFVADHDPEFKNAVKDSAYLIPDGIGIVYANLLLNFSLISRIAGIDMFYYLLDRAEQSSDPVEKRIFFLGSMEPVLDKIRAKLKVEFPSLVVETYSPPYKETFTAEDNAAMIGAINRFKPYVLFVGMTAPKQEKWVAANKDQIDAVFFCSIGAVFDFYSGRIKRPGWVWRALGLEWLGRFSKEPRRLWRRTLVSAPYFVKKIFGESARRLFKIG